MKGYNRAIGYQNGDQTIALAQRIPPSIRITDTSRFEFLAGEEEVGFDVLVMSFSTGRVGSVVAVGQVIKVKGLGYRLRVLRLKEQTNGISTSRQGSMYMMWTSAVFGSLVLPVAACSTAISSRPSQETVLRAFLRTTDSNPAYPPRSDQITEEAHG